MINPRSYFRIMLGRQSCFAREGFDGSFIGCGFLAEIDFTGLLPDNLRDFNNKFRPVFLEAHPEKTKVAAGLACGALHTICKGIKKNDIVLCPNGNGQYWIGEVASDYEHAPEQNMPHRRNVNWLPVAIERSDMSQSLQNSSGSIGTVSNLSKYAEEIDGFIAGKTAPSLISTDELVEDPSVFALEKHLEDFLVANWKNTSLGTHYDIVEDDGEIVGQQYPSDTGPIDLLAISKDKKEYLVIELKKGRASDAVVGQIQRYMGFVQEDLLETEQKVRGIIIALEDDLRLRRALAVTNNIEFYKYEVSFNLLKT